MISTKSAKYSPQDIKERADIVGYISSCGVELTPSGNRYQALCPSPKHDDRKTKSFTVYPGTQSFFCYGCGWGGDIFDFIQGFKSLSFPEAVREAAAFAGIPLESLSPGSGEEDSKWKVTRDILTATAYFYHQRLTTEVRACLTNTRGLIEDTIESEVIGYAPPTGNNGYEGTELLATLEKKGFTREQSVEAGVIYKDGREYFSGHIVYPDWSFGKVAYMTGRGFPKKSHKKPLADKLPCNSPFGGQGIGKGDPITVEGEADVYILKQAGLNACGTYGANGFRKEWVGKFKNVEKVYIAMDGDDAGRKTSETIAALLKDKARIITFPETKTPDGKKIKDWNELFVEKYAKDIPDFQRDFRELMAQAETLLEYKIHQIPKDTPERDVPGLLQPLLSEISRLSEVEHDIYINLIVEYFKGTTKLTKQSLKRDIGKFAKATQRTSGGAADSPEDNCEILGDDYKRFTPAQDFIDGVSYLTVPLDVRMEVIVSGVPVPKVTQIPYILTSRRELFRLDELALLDERKLIVNSHPEIPGYNRWPVSSIDKFMEGKETIDPAVVFYEIRAIYDHYLDFRDPATSSVLAITTVGTYFYRVFESFPYIAFTAEKGSGKSKILLIAEKLCFNAVLSCNTTLSSLFRLIDGSAGTFLLDEAEVLKDPKYAQELRSVLNSGYKKGSQVHRTNLESKDQKVESFDTYSPKIIAGIRGLEEVLESRCITFPMLKTRDEEKANRDISESGEDWVHLRHLLYSFGLTFAGDIREIYLSDTGIRNIRAVYGREGELWRPILCIAQFLEANGCEGIFDWMKEVASRKSQSSRTDGLDDWSNALLLALDLVTQDSETGISTSDIRDALLGWFQEKDKKPSPRWIGAQLKTWDLVENRRKTSSGYIYTIRHATVKDRMDRYGV